jgi:hypothetical protein
MAWAVKYFQTVAAPVVVAELVSLTVPVAEVLSHACDGSGVIWLNSLYKNQFVEYAWFSVNTTVDAFGADMAVTLSGNSPGT